MIPAVEISRLDGSVPVTVRFRVPLGEGCAFGLTVYSAVGKLKPLGLTLLVWKQAACHGTGELEILSDDSGRLIFRLGI